MKTRKSSTDYDPRRMLDLHHLNEYLRITRRFLEAFFSNRKLAVGTLLTLGLLLYLWPAWFRNREPASDESMWCLNDKLRGYAGGVDAFNSAVFRWPQSSEADDGSVDSFMPFVGNGHFGFTPVDKQSTLRMRHGRSLSVNTGFSPLASFSVIGHSRTSDAFVTEYFKGSVTHLQCVSIASHCVVISSLLYVHRVHPSVIVQDVYISNPLDTSIEVAVSVPKFRWQETVNDKINGHEVTIGTASVSVPDDSSGRIYIFSSILPAIPSKLIIKPRSTESYHFVTIVDSSESAQTNLYENNKVILIGANKKLYESLSGQSAAALYSSHVSAWAKLWQAGFSISYSRAPSVLNGAQINATIYGVLSNAPAPIHESHFSDPKALYRKAILNVDGCYNSHNTLLYPSKLWPNLLTVDDIVDVTNSWLLTLQRTGGCQQLLEAGADGVLQAMLLSFGGLKFTHHHLEFDTEPKDLHRDMFFRKIAYNMSYIDIWVEIDQENKAHLFVSVNNSVSPSALVPLQSHGQVFYACDAGCLDTPVQLGHDRSQFPVKLTDPLTPVLYVTADRDHVLELKHTIHVKEVVEAPAHDHQLIAIHKHGHRLGGLPAFFWVALIFLIVVFHLFLCKLIYNEYYRDDTGRTYSSVTRGKYSL